MSDQQAGLHSMPKVSQDAQQPIAVQDTPVMDAAQDTHGAQPVQDIEDMQDTQDIQDTQQTHDTAAASPHPLPQSLSPNPALTQSTSLTPALTAASSTPAPPSPTPDQALPSSSLNPASPSLAAAPPTTISTPPRTINLKVLSPALEATSGFQLGATAIDTTVGALKQKICDLVPGHPRPEEQRLIYHGRVLPNESQTLAGVFGATAIQQESDFTIHLVVRPVNGAAPTSATATPPPRSRVQTPLQPGASPRHAANPLANNHAAPLPRPLHQNPAAALHGQVVMGGMQPVPGMHGFMLPQMPGVPAFPQQQFQQQHFQAAQNHAQMQHNLQLAQAQQNQSQQLAHAQARLQAQALHQHHQNLAQPQQSPHQTPTQAAAGQQPATTSASPVPQPRSGQASPAPQPATTGTATRTINGPNGARYTVRVNHSTFAIHPPGQQQPGQIGMQHNPFGNFQQLQLNPFNAGQHRQQAPSLHARNHQPPPFDLAEAFDDPVTASDVRELAELTSQFAQLMQAETGISETAREAAQTLQNNTRAIASRLRDVRSSAPRPQHQQQTPFQPAPGVAQVQHYDATAATVYLLSSPTGPHAVLFAPQGTYTGQPQAAFNVNPMAPYQGLPLPHAAPFAAGHALPTDNDQPANPAALPEAPANPPPLIPAGAVPGQPAQGMEDLQNLVRQMNQLQQPNDVLAAWQPILAQFWLLFRVMLFAYFFFPTDQGWYRPAVMAIVCLAFWLLNGEGFGRGVREAVRGWWEGVVGVPPQRATQPGQRNDGQPAVTAAPVQPAQPQEQQLHWIRQTFRPLERALALFLASLWPGIGERTVAARRAEEERQRREEREEAQRREAAAAAAVADVVGESANMSTVHENGNDTATATVSTGTDVNSSEELRERKAASRAATVEEEVETAEHDGPVNQIGADW